MASKLMLRTKCVSNVLLIAFLALGFCFLWLSLSVDFTQAAPAVQGGMLQLTLPVTNTNTQTSIYAVTNLSTRTISARHEFYMGGFSEGRFVAVFTDTYILLENKFYALNRIPNFPQNFVGEVVIIANQPITGSVTVRPIAPPISIQPPTNPEGMPLLPPLPPLRPERVEINWTLITYLIVGLFALSGFFRGWWKEAITTFFVGILILFLALPSIAKWFIDTMNSIILFIADKLSELGIITIDNVIQLNPSSNQTWLIILLLFIGLAIFISRASLSSRPLGQKAYVTYVVTPIGSVLGAILGGLNGFLIITLIKHYLEGSNLPGGGLPTEIVMSGGNVVTASPGLEIQVTNLPSFTFFNAFLPWLIIVFGITIFFMMWRSWRKHWPWPWDYIQHTFEIKKEKDKTTITTTSASISIFISSSE